MSDPKAMLFKPLDEFEETIGECLNIIAGEREARVRAETANRQKDEFLMIVAHELRNSMNSIVGWLELCQSERLNEPAARRAIESINRGVKRQVRLIEDLSDASQISSGKFRLNLRDVEIVPILEDVLNDFKVLAEAKQVKLEAIIAADLGRVAGDSQRLEQVLWNLLANAVKFTSSGGKICVIARQQEHHLDISVSDTGQGIDSEFLPFVFEPFRQAEHSANDVREGVGLGLSIVRQIIELHGGSIKADSAGCDKGSVFTIRLPKKPPAFIEPYSRLPIKATGIAAKELF